MSFAYFNRGRVNRQGRQQHMEEIRKMRAKEKQLQMDMPKSTPAVFRQRQLTDDSPFPFGKWKGTPMQNVPASFLDWFIGQDWAPKWPAVVEYVNRTRNAIDQDLKRNGSI